jgi:hypothetical protein
MLFAVLSCAGVGWGQTAMAAASWAPAAAALPASAPLNTKIFPLSEIRRGQRGVAYTVFEGVTPEPMEVEILGVLKDSLGPGQDMILGRLHGAKPEYTGVVAGMSGSPVYIDGRLVGALSYRIGQFSKEPICGITPIELMLAVRDGDGVGRAVGVKGKEQTTASAEAGPSTPAAKYAAFAQDDTSWGGAGRDNNFLQPIATPLVFGGGFGRETVERFGDRFRAMGMEPVAGLGGADPKPQPEPLVPGSAVSAVLVQGDLAM